MMFWVCASLFGAAGLREFSEDVVHDPAVAALRKRVTARLDATSPRGAATAAVRTTDGRVLTSTVRYPKGSAERPLSDAEIEAKARVSAALGAFPGSLDEVIAAVWRLETLPSIEPLLRGLRP